MSRNIRDEVKAVMFAQETEHAFITLVTISHSTLASPIRVTTDPMIDLDGNGTMGVRSRGEDFIALPFDIVWPNEDEEQSPVAKVQIDNISREIVFAIRQITSPADFLVEIVTTLDTDVVEASLVGFQLRNVRYNSLIVEGDLTIEQFDQEPFPAGRFDPSRFPGMF